MVMRKEAPRGRFLQFMDFVRNNKIKTFCGVFVIVYVTLMPFVPYFPENSHSAEYRAEERAKGNKRFLAEGRK